jgi:hypothetical protein
LFDIGRLFSYWLEMHWEHNIAARIRAAGIFWGEISAALGETIARGI